MNSDFTRPEKIQRGFTLLELLIAMSIFALVSAMAYGGLDQVLKGKDLTEEKALQLKALQRAFLMIERDIEQAAPRSIRDSYGTLISPMVGVDSGLEFTRGGWQNPNGLVRSSLQRINYYLKDDQLVRQSWGVLDRAQDSTPTETVLLRKIESFELRFLLLDKQWTTTWPPLSASLTEDPPPKLPRAVEFSVEVENFGRVTRLFRALPHA